MKKQILNILTITFAVAALMCSCSSPAPTQKVGPLDRYKVDTEAGSKVEGIYARLYNSIVDKSCVLREENLTPTQAEEALNAVTAAYQKYYTYSYNYAHLTSDSFRDDLEQKLLNFTDHIDYIITENKYSDQTPFVRMGE